MGIRSIVLSGLLLTVPIALPAHPHVWVDVVASVVIEAGVLEGLEVEMTLDDVYSSLVLEDTAPGAKTLDATAIEAIRKSYFKDLAYFGYLTQLSWGKQRVKVPEPQRFSASLGGQGRITYRFYLPLRLRLAAGSVFSATFSDESYYVDVGFASKTPVTLKTMGPGTPTLRVVPPAAFELQWKP